MDIIRTTARRTKIVDLPSYEGGQVSIYTGGISEEQTRALNKKFPNVKERDDVDAAQKGKESVFYLIKEWNLGDENGELIPLTLENADKMFYSLDWMEIMEATTPNKEERVKKL